MATKASILHPSNEKLHSFSRITREGKKITYTLEVVQQPERARACGAGAKSSADRRPVDPPPVVEMHIYESDPNNDMQKTEITFAYNANFFLFTTLEWARPMAHGRVQGQPSACPVLTGVPVAGVAYLDRPTPGGYFIFPDLSVRHEGLYRLNFSLYEEPKDPKDEDKDAPLPGSDALAGKNKRPEKNMYFRLEVKTSAFTVFSAKKFPGLSESTSLSRLVAEQGCRVRIRRDVRMRRREPKAGKDFGYDERHMTPDTYPSTPVERPRSASNTSVDGSYGYCPTPQRVPSAQGFYPHQPYQHTPPMPLPPGPPVQATQSHLSFGAAQPQYPTPQLPPQHAAVAPPPPPPPPAPYASPLPAYNYPRQPSSASEYESQQHAQKYQHYQSPRPQNIPKPSLPPITIPMDPHKPYEANRPNDYRSSDPKAYHSTAQMPPPPLTPATSHMPPTLPTPTPKSYPIEPEHPTTSHENPIPVSPTYDPSRKKGWAFDAEPVLSSKRQHSDAFGSAHLNQPLHHGKRPDSIPDNANNGRRRHDSIISAMSDDDTSTGYMFYKRADGRIAKKKPGTTA